MKSKLTLSINKEAIAKAKKLARKKNSTVSQMVENFIEYASQIVKDAVAKSWNEIEDVIQHECAIIHNERCIITRNKKDFELSKIPVFHPLEWIHEFVE